MTRREKTLAFMLLPPLFLVGIGFLVFQLWIEPLHARTRRIQDLQTELDDKRLAVAKAAKKAKDLDTLKVLSLPGDVVQAGRLYEEELNRLIRASGFDAGSTTITSKKPDTRTSPVLAKGQPPIYTKLEFTVGTKGELLSLAEFMEKFYKVPLLHQIRNMKIIRPSGSDRNRTYDLDITLNIEALVLTDGNHRKTLLPEDPPAPPVTLHGGDRKYATIAGRDMFFGPPPPGTPTGPVSSEIDFAKFVKFDGFHNGDHGPTITLWDAYNNQDQTIRPRADGDGYRVDVTYLLNGKKKQLRSGKTLDILDENGAMHHRWLVLRATERELYLQDEEAQYVLHIGQWLSEMQRLTSEESVSLGLSAPAAKEADKAVRPPVEDVREK